MKKFFLLPVLLALSCTDKQACIDASRINRNGVCTMQYDPVCGCDGKTYGNECEAGNAGVTHFTKGECK